MKKDYYVHYLDNNEPSWLSDANYRILYIGKKTDTIYLNPYIDYSGYSFLDSIEKQNFFSRPEIMRSYQNYKSHTVEWPNRPEHKNYTSSKVEIQLDTNQRLAGLFSVLLTNLEFDTITICFGQYLPLIMEAKDTLGNWLAVQEINGPWCGVGVGFITLPPGECVVTFAPVFKGEYKTQLRLKLGNNYSKPFTGRIKYRQFRSMWKDGNYCDEYIEDIKNEYQLTLYGTQSITVTVLNHYKKLLDRDYLINEDKINNQKLLEGMKFLNKVKNIKTKQLETLSAIFELISKYELNDKREVSELDLFKAKKLCESYVNWIYESFDCFEKGEDGKYYYYST